MRVLHVVPSLARTTGGPAVSVVESCLALERAGVRTTVMATDMRGPAGAASPGAATADDLPEGAEHLDVRLYPTRPPRRLVFSPALDRGLALETRHCDLVHIHSLYLFPQFAAGRRARQRGVPYVVSPRGALDPYLRRKGRVRKAVTNLLWQNSMLGHAAGLHVTAIEEEVLIRDVAPGVPRFVIPNGVRWAEFQTLPGGGDFRRRYLAGAAGPVVLNIGRIARKKGLDVLVRAFGLVARDRADARLVLVGPDDEALGPELLALAAAEGVSGRVVLTGMLNGAPKLAALAAADVWALPSHSENFGLAVVEALAAGKPSVISTGVNIAPEIEAERAALVCPPSPDAFAAAIGRLLDDPALRADTATRARAFARRFDWSAVGPQLVQMYESILQASAKPAPTS